MPLLLGGGGGGGAPRAPGAAPPPPHEHQWHLNTLAFLLLRRPFLHILFALSVSSRKLLAHIKKRRHFVIQNLSAGAIDAFSCCCNDSVDGQFMKLQSHFFPPVLRLLLNTCWKQSHLLNVAGFLGRRLSWPKTEILIL
jgi:hypothetical protein